MAARIIDIVVPRGDVERLEEILADRDTPIMWSQSGTESANYRVLVQADQVEHILDPLQAAFGSANGLRVAVCTVEASLPKDPAPSEETDTPPEERKKQKRSTRISREELYQDLSELTLITPVFVATVFLSTIVAAIGLIRDSSAVLIGAMVIAPLLGPNMALALATTLGDFPLAARAIKANSLGVAVALAVSFILGLLLKIDPASPEVLARTTITYADLLLALSAGVAGALAFTTGVSSALVGVMVAVALLPPLVVFAMLLGCGEIYASGGAALMFATNLICVNLAGVATFLIQGIRPRNWWEAKQAKSRAMMILALWVLLLAIVAFLVWLSQVRSHDPTVG